MSTESAEVFHAWIDSGKKSEKVLYVKGGHAIAEAERLFSRAGELPRGGPDQFLLAVLRCAKGADFQLASLGARTLRKRIGEREALECGARSTHGLWLYRKFVYMRESLRLMVQTMQWKPTHVLCGIGGPFVLIALWAARWSGARFVFLVHEALDLPSISWVNRLTHRCVVQRADALIVHGPFLRAQVLGLGGSAEQIYVFDTGFDQQQGLQLPIERDQLPRGVTPDTFLYVGRIEEAKGVFDLLDAFAHVRQNLSAQLVFVGAGSAIQKLQRRAAEHAYETDIRILGNVPHQEIFALMRQSLAVVTPTQACFPEGRCMSAMEAFFVGTPVIAPNFGPFPYLVHHGKNGLLYTPDSTASLAAEMRALRTDTALLATLRDGAVATGLSLAKPEKTFLQAVYEAAFVMGGTST